MRKFRQRPGETRSASATSEKTAAYFEIKSVIGVRHQVVFVGALELEAVCNSPFGSPVLPVAAEVHQTLVVTQLLEVLVVVGYYAVA